MYGEARDKMNLRQRSPRVRNDAFLRFVRSLPCAACSGPAPNHAAHLRTGSLAYNKRATGAGEKPSDQWCTPLCQECHLTGPQAQHRTGEAVFWTRVGKDPFALALSLYTAFTALSAEKPAKPPRQRQKRASSRGAKVRMPKRKWASRPFPKGRKIENRRAP